MKYVKRIPSTDEALRESMLEKGWNKIKEPPNLFTAFLFSIPFILINVLISYLIIALVDKEIAEAITELFAVGEWSFTIRFDFIIYSYLLILFHEVFHLILIPNFMQSENTYFGIKPWGGFVFTTEKLSKGRFLLISLGPFLALSVIMPIILGFLGLLSGFLVFLVFLNAMASSVDTLNAFLILIQVPKSAVIVNNGFESYYKVK